MHHSDASYEIVLHPQYMEDAILWKAFKSGDEKALVIMFDRFTRPMFNYGSRLVPNAEMVKDCIQDLFIEIWRNRERLGDTHSIKYYLFKSLRRKLSRMNAKAANQNFAQLTDECISEVTPSQESVIIGEQSTLEKEHKVHTMLSTLSPRQREAMFLRYFEDLSCDQIAGLMRLNKQAVYNLIHNALVRLKQFD